MKYRKLLLVPMAALLFLLSACSCAGKAKPNPIDNVTYSAMHADWPRHEITQELVEVGAYILIGTVTDISYQMLDTETYEPPTEKSNNYWFYTIYDIKVIQSYKGDAGETIKARKLGGDMGVREEEQLKALGEYADKWGIPIMDEWPNVEMGKTYLFVLYGHEAKIPSILTPYQGVYELTDTEKTAAPGEIPTLKDIITYFGPEAWNEFQKLLPSLR